MLFKLSIFTGGNPHSEFVEYLNAIMKCSILESFKVFLRLYRSF